MSNEWKPGDTVTFTEAGTIMHIADGIATIDVRGIPHTLHVSHIIGTPEQAKRERIMSILRQEFGFHFRLEPMPNDDKGFFVVIEDVMSEDLREQWIQTIRERVTELEAQQEI